MTDNEHAERELYLIREVKIYKRMVGFLIPLVITCAIWFSSKPECWWFSW